MKTISEFDYEFEGSTMMLKTKEGETFLTFDEDVLRMLQKDDDDTLHEIVECEVKEQTGHKYCLDEQYIDQVVYEIKQQCV